MDPAHHVNGTNDGTSHSPSPPGNFEWIGLFRVKALVRWWAWCYSSFRRSRGLGELFCYHWWVRYPQYFVLVRYELEVLYWWYSGRLRCLFFVLPPLPVFKLFHLIISHKRPFFTSHLLATFICPRSDTFIRCAHPPYCPEYLVDL